MNLIDRSGRVHPDPLHVRDSEPVPPPVACTDDARIRTPEQIADEQISYYGNTPSYPQLRAMLIAAVKAARS